MTKQIKYYKVTNKNKNHHSFQYRNGLNILTESFDRDGYDETTHNTKAGYILDLKNIRKFIEHGVYIREILLPTDDPSFRMIKNERGDEYRSNMIILGKKYNMFDIKTIIRFKLYLSSSFVDHVSGNGHVNVLEWLKNSGYKIRHPGNACKSRHSLMRDDVSEWLKKSGYEYESDSD